jgi:hypothetical protein
MGITILYSDSPVLSAMQAHLLRPTAIRKVPLICKRSYVSPGRLSLAFDLHEPTKRLSSAPEAIIFMHGLFGSKKNNRSISK